MFEQVWPTPDPPDGADLALYRADLRMMPPSTLDALCTVGDAFYWDLHAPLWRYTRDAQRGLNSRGAPILAGARLVADRIAHRGTSPAQVMRLAKLELGRTWPISLEPDLQVLMSRVCADKEPIEAIANFARQAPSGAFELVENDLLHREFAWPLVVATRRDGVRVGCSLPVIVTVVMDSTAAGPPVEIRCPAGLVNADGWRDFAKRALWAAKDLWVYKRTSWDEAFRRRIERARLILDFSVAEAVVEPYREWFAFSLEDDSLEAYLATLVACRFFGQAAFETVSATGSLGTRDRDPTQDSGGDRWIKPVQGIDAKIDYAESTRLFDQIIIPATRESVPYRPGIKVVTGARLSHYVEHVVGQVWRKHRYVRCPDLDLAFHAYKRAPEPEFSINIRALLKANNNPILRLDGFTGEQAAAALYFVSREASNNKSLSHFTYIRAAEEEGLERFWETILWALEDGELQRPPSSLFATTQEIADRLDRALNFFESTPERPVRAPDIMVIVGANRLPPGEGIPGGPRSRLDFGRVMETLGPRLGRTRTEAVCAEIGATRVLLIDETMDVGTAIPDIETASEAAAIGKLSVFRQGFTAEMARRLLDLDEAAFPTLLRDLRVFRAGLPLVSDADAAGEFYLPRRVDLPHDREALARLHYEAANAIVGFLEPDIGRLRLDVSRAFQPHWRHEAQWHLSQAARNATVSRGRYRSAQERLNRVAEPLNLARLRWASTRSHEEGLDTWDSLWRSVSQSLSAVHPMDLVLVARFANKLISRYPKRAAELIEARDACFSKAIVLCDRINPRPKRWPILFYVAAARACQIMAETRDLAGWDAAKDWNRIACETMSDALEVADAEWFEFRADREGDPAAVRQPRHAHRRFAAAARYYRLGFWNPCVLGAQSDELRLIIKWLGALAQAGTQPPLNDLRRIVDLPDRTRHWYRDNCKTVASGLSELPSVQLRWRIGCHRLEDIWGMRSI